MMKRISAALLSMGLLMLSAARAEEDPAALQLQKMTLRYGLGKVETLSGELETANTKTETLSQELETAKADSRIDILSLESFAELLG